MALHHTLFLYDAEQYITYIIDEYVLLWFKVDDIDTILEYRHSLLADYQREWYEIGDPGSEDPYTVFVSMTVLVQWLSSAIETPVVVAFKRWIFEDLLLTIREQLCINM
ncbi:hypothetical protein CDAR_444721 [Caerostris darwini]|uniref:Bro-N domain-containing protein n=1 Tax=Caerostris darwini TaxID=1538125 RepID=A0AAV4W5W8_9ARAC|nr:hypothetical protein CDAR_444721 [Caerostris darwini]